MKINETTSQAKLPANLSNNHNIHSHPTDTSCSVKIMQFKKRLKTSERAISKTDCKVVNARREHKVKAAPVAASNR